MTPCLNGGVCSANTGIGFSGLVSCSCPPGYTGQRCECKYYQPLHQSNTETYTSLEDQLFLSTAYSILIDKVVEANI